MPEQIRDIKRRIKSTQSTQQITKAMEMVSAVQLRRAQERAEAARPYAEAVRDLTGWLVSRSDSDNPLLAVRDARRLCYVVVTGDRGMCGAYNARIIKEAQLALKDHPDAQLLLVGRKGRDFFRRRGTGTVGEYVNLGNAPGSGWARQIGAQLTSLYVDRQLDEIHLIYMQFISTARQQPRITKLLPVEKAGLAEAGPSAEYIFEPDQETVLDTVLPRYIEAQIYQALLEAKASEEAQRMLSMGAATDNAGELIKQLTLNFNKARQAAITKELSEIVGGVEALKG
jgi:F-type H+-transporting ATPase subunit gamma